MSTKATKSGDSIDTAIASLIYLSAASGKEFWTYVQAMPHLFSVGGLFYKQVKRDLGLIDGKHCQLPSLPGKVFQYHAKEDRLELCLEPFGHFPVELNIEQKIRSNIEVKSGQSPKVSPLSTEKMPAELQYVQQPIIISIQESNRDRSNSIPEESELCMDENEAAKLNQKSQKLETGNNVQDEESNSKSKP